MGSEVPQWGSVAKPQKGFGEQSPQKLTKNVKLVYNFNVFL